MPTTQTTDIAATVKQIRKDYAAARTIQRNIRLGRYQGRNSDSTSATLDYRYAQANRLMVTLSRKLQGLLTDEFHLAERISENRDMGQDRPELRARIAATRKAIKTLVEESSVQAAVARLEAASQAELADDSLWVRDAEVGAHFNEDGRQS